MVERYITKIFNYLKSENFRNNLIIILSMISINFATYIAYFDLNSLSIIDSTTISKHIINLLIPYILVSVSVQLIIHAIDMNFPTKMKELHIYFSKLGKVPLWINLFINAINVKIVKYGIIILLFSFVYVGKMGTLFMVLVTIILIFSFFLSYYTYIIIMKIAIKRIIKFESIKKVKMELEEIIHNKNDYKNILFNNIGIIMIFFSFILGIARASHVEKTVHVHINNDQKSYVLYMTTMSGVGLFNNKLKQASFKSWDSIDNLIFNVDNKKTFKTFFDSIK